jgi:arabinogalactan oligomer/maltooligosaccharide transport system permease protein
VAQTQAPVEAGAPERPGAQPLGRRPRSGSTTTTTTGLIVKIVLLGLVLAVAIFAAFPLIEQGQWLGLALVVGVTALLFWIYLSPRRIPAKYLIPGTLFLLAFQVFPVLYTMSTAFTNFGDAHRGSKEDAIRAIEGASITKVEGSTDYRLAIATKGDPATGDIVFLLSDPETRASRSTRPTASSPCRPTASSSRPRATSPRRPATRSSPSAPPGPGSWPPSPPAPGSGPATRSRSWSTPSASTSSTPRPATPSASS